jgi:hypothetical protein
MLGRALKKVQIVSLELERVQGRAEALLAFGSLKD